MEKLESIAFLAICFGVPLAMVAIVTYRIVRWLIVRSRTRRRLAAGGWASVDAAALRARLAGTGLDRERARLSKGAQRGDVVVARWAWSSRGTGKSRRGETRNLLIVPRAEPGPCGVLQPRLGGVLERAALAVASALGQEPVDVPGWEWALVMPARGDAWIDDACSAPLEALLAKGERLHLGERHVALALGPDGFDALIETAGERAEQLARALQPSP